MENGAREVLGWDRFFTELMGLINFSSRRTGTADRHMATYIVERLQIASQSVAAIFDVLRSVEEGQDQLRDYQRCMEDVIDAIHHVISFWETYMGTLDRQMEGMAYHAPRVYTGPEGKVKILC